MERRNTGEKVIFPVVEVGDELSISEYDLLQGFTDPIRLSNDR